MNEYEHVIFLLVTSFNGVPISVLKNACSYVSEYIKYVRFYLNSIQNKDEKIADLFIK